MDRAYQINDVIAVERQAIDELLALNPDLYSYNPTFIQYVMQHYHPEWQATLGDTKIIRVAPLFKNEAVYYWEEVGSYLWSRWNTSKDDNDRNNLLTYIYPIIDGQIFRRSASKMWQISYPELFQELVLSMIRRIPKFDSSKTMGKSQSPATTFAYFNYATKMELITITTKYRNKALEKFNATNWDDDYMESAVSGDPMPYIRIDGVWREYPQQSFDSLMSNSPWRKKKEVSQPTYPAEESKLVKRS